MLRSDGHFFAKLQLLAVTGCKSIGDQIASNVAALPYLSILGAVAHTILAKLILDRLARDDVLRCLSLPRQQECS
jgi:hypothetical protein